MLTIFAQYPLIWCSCMLVLGLLVGSFLNVVILRLPKMMQRQWKIECEQFLTEVNQQDNPKFSLNSSSDLTQKYNLNTPASHCPSCKAPVKAWMNIPILSYLILKGQCASCGIKISLRYPSIELITALLTLAVAVQFGYSPQALFLMPFMWVMVALTMIDYDTKLLPDQLTLPLLWAGLLINLNGTFVDINSAIIGAAAGYLFLWSIYWAFKLIRGKEGMGYGDFKLFAAFGAWFGFAALPSILLLSSVVGAVLGIILLSLKNKNIDTQLPFGPYLTGAALVYVFFQEPLLALLQFPV